MNRKLLKQASLYRLQVFVTLCQVMHMGRAAERLGITQPSLSALIRELEETLDARLFNRRNRAIDLTDAGRLLHEEAQTLLNIHANAMDRVKRVARGEMGRLSLGFVGSALAEVQLVQHLKRVQGQLPNATIELNELNCQAAIDALLRNEVDLVILRGPGVLPDFLLHRVLSVQPLVVVLPPQHPLCQHATLSIKQLAGQPLIGYPEVDDNYGITPVIRGLAQMTGTPLEVQWKVTTVAGVLNMVASGTGIGIAPALAAERASSSVAVRPLQEEANSELWLVWHQLRSSVLLQRFLAALGSDIQV